MSDSTIQTGAPGRSSRSERVPVSCGECRRRKQKCNQGQPCSNCARRFPPPLCEYIASTHRHNDGPTPYSVTTVPFGHLPPAFAGDEHVLINGLAQPILSPTPAEIQYQDQQWSPADWQNFAESTATTPWAAQWQQQAPSPSSSSSFGGQAASPARHALPSTGSGCLPGCTFHSEAQHTADTLLRRMSTFPAEYIQRWQPAKTDEVLFWLTRQVAFEASSPGSSNTFMASHFQPTRQDAELLRIFVNFVSRFKAALDGEPDMSNNAYMRQYVPFCLHSPLLIQTAIYTSACFLNETEDGPSRLINDTMAVAHKCRSIQMLNEHLQTHGSTTDEAIAAVMQLMLNEWYWGNMGDLRAHLSGLREMVRLRGGFGNLGLGSLLARLVIVSDIAIALSFEIPPHLQGGPEFAYRDTAAIPFRIYLNTPFVPSLAPFSRCAEPLQLHSATAQILDDMRFLIGLVLALPESPSEKDIQKITTTSAWMYQRISSLPADSPLVQPHRGSESTLSPERSSGLSTTSRLASSGGPRPRKPSRHHSPSNRHPAVAAVLSDTTSSSTALGSPPPDMLYQAVRQAALIYTRALAARKPLRDPSVCSTEDFTRLWTTVWSIPLRRWRAVLGVFVWVVLSVLPASRGTAHGRFVKGLVTVGMSQMGMEDWVVAEKSMRGALALVAWLNVPRNDEAEALASSPGGGTKRSFGW